MGTRNKHEWNYVAATNRGELSFCRFCNQYRLGDGVPFKLKPGEYDKLAHGLSINLIGSRDLRIINLVPTER